MPNALFIQSYPAPGVQIVPATYTVAKGGYAFIALITLLTAVAVRGLKPENWRWLPLGIVIYLGMACLALIFFRSFKLDIRNDGISYANALRNERFLAFNEISAVVLFTNRWAGYSDRRISLTMPGTMVITPKSKPGSPSSKFHSGFSQIPLSPS